MKSSNSKIQISINAELLERIDKYAENNYMSRSGFFAQASNQFLAEAEILGFVKDASLALRKIADSGSIDQETLIGLQELERTCKLLIGRA